MIKRFAIAVLGAALALGVAAAAGSGEPGRAGGHARVGQAIVVHPPATPIVRG